MSKKQNKLHWTYTFGISLIPVGIILSTVLHKKSGTGPIGLLIIVLGTAIMIYGIKKSKK